MEAIAAGKGRKPKPFMLQGGKVEADAVWDSRTGLAAEERKAEARGKKKPKAVTAANLPDFIAPQLCETLAPSAVGEPAGCMRSSSMAIASRCACLMARQP